MATVVKTEWHPNAGSVWKRAVELWVAYLPQLDFTFNSGTGAVGGHPSLSIELYNDTDDYQWILVDGSIRNTDALPYDTLASLSGWRFMPPVQPTAFDSRVTADDWVTYMHTARRYMLAQWTGGLLTDDVTNSFTNDGFGAEQTVTQLMVYERSSFLIDWTVVTVKDQTDDEYYYASQPVSVGGSNASVAVAAVGGGGSSDMTGVVDALHDLLNRDTMTQVNNGAVTVLQWSGDVIENP